MSKKKSDKKMNYPFSNEIKQLKEEYKKMIDAMTDTDYEEMWAEDEGWEDEAAKFYKYDGNNYPLDDEDLPF